VEMTDKKMAAVEEVYARLVEIASLQSPSLEEVTDPNRRKRFEMLNPILEGIARKKAKKGPNECSDFLGTPYSSVQWKDIESVYDTTEFYSQTGLEVNDDKIDVVHKYLDLAHKCFGNLITGKEAKRLQFIAPILVLVCSHFGDKKDVGRKRHQNERAF